MASRHRRSLTWMFLILSLIGTTSFRSFRVHLTNVFHVEGTTKNDEVITLMSSGEIGRNIKRMKHSRVKSRLFSTQNFDSRNPNAQSPNGTIDLLYDGDCPICMMEVEFLKKRDLKSRIRFTDLRDPTYNPADHGNVTFEDGMRKLRAVLPDGSVAMGVEVFRKTYKAIGLGWVFELTNLPLVGKVADNLYDIWAENRLRLTGRGELADILKARAKELQEMEPIEDCEEECGIDYDDLP